MNDRLILKSTTIRRIQRNPDGSETVQEQKALTWRPDRLHRAFKRLGLLKHTQTRIKEQE